MIARTVVVEQTIDYVTADETDTAGDDTWFDHLGSRPITWLSDPRNLITVAALLKTALGLG